MFEAPARHVLGVQVSAYSVITANGETGTIPTGVNFQIGGGSPQSGPAPSEGPPSPSSNSQVSPPAYEGHDMNALIPSSAFQCINSIEREQPDDSWGPAQDQWSHADMCLSSIMPRYLAFGIPTVQAVHRGGHATAVFLQAYPAIS